jgi:hypothetical protein
MRIALAAVAVALVTLPSEAVHAWGEAGHRAVAMVAAIRLTPVSAKAVATLLRGQSMADAANWADDVRNTTHPHTTSWHFTNIPITSSGYRRSRDCARGNCVIAAIERQAATLSDRTKPRAERAEALKFLIHFIGDIHQPLHTGDNGDRGGNEVAIAMVGDARNLHAAWDFGVMQAQGVGTKALVAAAEAWLDTQTEATVAGGSVVSWAEESQRIARDIVYRQVRGDKAIVGAEQVEALRIIEQRIAQAGVRLAAVLNRAVAVANP